MKRLLLASTTAFGLSWVPVAAVIACSCALPASPAETVAASELAFVGTVVGSAPAPKDPKGFGQMVRYAFTVERASDPIEGGVVQVAALAGDGGAACGFTFGEGERWFVATHRGDGGLDTGLCSGNRLVQDLSDTELEALMAALPVVPSIDSSSGPELGIAIPPAVLLGGAATALVVVVAALAFRREGRGG